MKKIEIKSKSFQNAIAKATQVKPLVRLGASPDLYLVRGSSGDFYLVRFQRAGGGAMLGSCLCPAGLQSRDCYHLAAALLAHSAFIRCGLRVPAPRRSLASVPVLPEIADALRVAAFA